MSLDLLTDEELSTKPERPHDKWKNEFRILANWGYLRCAACGNTREVHKGEITRTHCRIFPSREIAEAHAMKSTALLLGNIEYIGPVKVD